MKIVAIIPARGGSKGLPRKNIYPLNGKPLIAYAIQAASMSKLISEVYVTTDNKEIASVAKAYGVKIIKRPASLSTDTASSESALLHAVKNIECTHILFMQCTSPLTTTEDINGMITSALCGRYDTMLSVCEPECRFLWNEAGMPVGHTLPRKRRQDLEPVFRETGAMYFMRKAGLQRYKNRFHGSIGLFKMPQRRSYDIDTKEDVEYIEKQMRCGLI